MFRDRQQAVTVLSVDMSEDNLWDAMIAFQHYPFHTAIGLPFTYELKKGRNKELIISRRTKSKTVVWSTVLLAFQKALGDIRGISYIFLISGVIYFKDFYMNMQQNAMSLKLQCKL